MELKFRCGHCQRKLEADATMANTVLPCPNCGFDVTIPEAHVRPGVTLGGFRIEHRLGKGAMGEVFLATQLAVDRSVALKVLPGRVVADSAFVDRFFQEVRLAARLEHPNIVTAYDAGQDHGYHYFAMAYVDGEALSQRLLRKGPMPEKAALEIGIKVARALAYAWDRGNVLHRDVKPSNIMIDSQGEPLIMDMGIAKSVRDESHLTATGIAMGTPHYMSPEQARGSNELDFRTDMYSLGATLYHLIGGDVPFTGNSAMEVVAKHMHDPLPPIRRMAPETTQACEELLRRMMQKDRQKRYPSWQACIDDMDLVIRGKMPLTAKAEVARQATHRLVKQRQFVGGKRSESASDSVLWWLSSSWVLPVCAVLVVGMLLGIAVGSGLLSVINYQQSIKEQESPRRTRVQHVLPAAGQIGHDVHREAVDPAKASSSLVPDEYDGEPYEPTVAADDFPRKKSSSPQVQGAPVAAQEQASGESPRVENPGESSAPNTIEQETSGKNTHPRRQKAASQEATEQLRTILDIVAAEFAAGHLARAADYWTHQRSGFRTRIPTEQLEKIDGSVDYIADMESRILASFREQIGNTIIMKVDGRPRRLAVRSVVPHAVKVMELLDVGAFGRTIALRDLDLAEKLRRLESPQHADAALAQALVLLWHGKSAAAREALSAFDGVLVDAMRARIDLILARELEKSADDAFLDLLKATLRDDLPGDRGSLMRALRERLQSLRRRERIKARLERYRERFGTTEIGRHRIAFLEQVLRYPFRDSDWALPDPSMDFVWVPSMNCWVGRCEVTNAQFRKHVSGHSSGTHHGLDLDAADAPAVSVSFDEATAFADFITEREAEAQRLPEDFVYRLPLRDEWTQLARCSDSWIYPWGKAWPPPADMNYNGREWPGPESRRIAAHTDPFPGTCPVRISGENVFRLLGVGGNAFEWTSGPDGRSPEQRGNSWCGADAEKIDPTQYAISARWARQDPSYKTPASGFRLLLAVRRDDLSQNETASRR